MGAPDSEMPLIVGIGASAGGLEAFKTFFQHMPADSGMAFVLVQHLDPDRQSMLTELLQRETAMPVAEAEDGAPVEPDHVFVIPPNASLTIENGRLGVETPAPPRTQRRPIDTFFTSLAEDQGENAVCIVLSGTGSDGSLGVRKIKEHGGYALAQAEFDNHAMDGMPHSAVATGAVDEVLKIEDMPAKLTGYRGHLHAAAAHKDSEGTRRDAGDHLETICKLLHERIGHDFSQYKDKTLTRRIQRRMQVLQVESMSQYIERLRAEPAEAERLFHELLIGVTQFFRDPDAWDALRQNVIPQLFEGKGAADTVRVWAPGCATGEEVYTVAMLLREALNRRDARPRIQIFGTDVDTRAVDVARAGRYKSLPGVDPERLERWFAEDGDAYIPVKPLREMCVFSPHDLVKDPPFSKLDLICCRNLMIYMKAELQDRVLRKFHYALKSDGWLFLGQAEGVSRHARLFAATDKKHRIFQRREAPAQSMHDFSLPGGPERQAGAPRPPPGASGRADDDRLDRNARRLMQKYSPAYVVIDRHHEILRFSGGETGPYLEPSAGAASLNLIGITKKALRPAVRGVVQKAFASGRAAVHEKLTLRVDGEARAITLIAEPLETNDALCVVAFQDTGAAGSAKTSEQAADAGVAELEQELHTTRVQLHATINELEATNEEMKSANEEYQSVNEELQSSNEELETSKEEMQSINEELQTINAELSSKNSQLNRANSDLANLLESTEIATIFLDNDLRVKSFTPRMRELFHLRDGDRGRPVTDIVTRLDYADLKRDVKEVLRSLGLIEREVRIEHEDSTYIMRIRPYRTVDNVIDGVVITFMDITDRRRHEVERAELAAIVDSSDDAIVSKNLDGVILTWNKGAEKLYGYSAEEAVGQPATMLMPPDRQDEEPGILERIRRGEVVDHYETVSQRKDGALMDISLTVSPTRNGKGKIVGASRIARDVSERRIAEDHHDLLLHELSHRVKNALATVQSIAMQTLNTAPDPETFQKTFQARIAALAHTHDLLMRSNWHGAALRELIARELAPYQNDQQPQWRAEGREIQLNAKAALALGMTVHELATNAAKYGALAKAAGWVEVKWQVKRDGTLHFAWTERDGPRVEEPERRGFGSRLIEEGLAYELDADVKLDYKPTGLRCTIDMPLKAVAADARDAASS
ncbi:MAG TPA: chemotaxis protein CheB [Gammaproteobacteria bacterium]|nr:chemotaxis protein CheB [Gammaproteobacteria bacterium]